MTLVLEIDPDDGVTRRSVGQERVKKGSHGHHPTALTGGKDGGEDPIGTIAVSSYNIRTYLPRRMDLGRPWVDPARRQEDV